MHGPFNLDGVVPPMARTVITKNDQDTMVQVLNANFGPNSPKQCLKHDPCPVASLSNSNLICVCGRVPSRVGEAVWSVRSRLAA